MTHYINKTFFNKMLLDDVLAIPNTVTKNINTIRLHNIFLVTGQDRPALWAWCRTEEALGSTACRGSVASECRPTQTESARC